MSLNAFRLSFAPGLTAALLAALLPLAAGGSNQAPESRALAEPAARVRVAAAGGVELSVRKRGAGRPVVLLTGGPGFSGSYLESTAARLAGCMTLLPDQRGTGESKVESFETGFDFATAVDDLESIRRHFDLERWTLVGHSWGGILAMAYAAEHPERVEALALVSSGGVDASFWTTYQTNISANIGEAARAELAALRPAGQTLEDFAEFSRAANRIMAPGMVASGEAVPQLMPYLDAEHFDPRVGLSMPELRGFDLAPKLKGFTRPALVLQGKQDPMGERTAEQVAQTLGTEVSWIEGSGHWPFFEQPEAFFAALDAFLETEVKGAAEPKGE